MEIFKQTNFDFLGKKWPFIGLSLLLTAVGLISLVVKGGPKYGIDFNGGALMYVKFAHRPSAEHIRSALRKRISGEIDVQEITNSQEVLVSTEVKDERTLNVERQEMVQALNDAFGDKSRQARCQQHRCGRFSRPSSRTSAAALLLLCLKISCRRWRNRY